MILVHHPLDPDGRIEDVFHSFVAGLPDQIDGDVGHPVPLEHRAPHLLGSIVDAFSQCRIGHRLPLQDQPADFFHISHLVDWDRRRCFDVCHEICLRHEFSAALPEQDDRSCVVPETERHIPCRTARPPRSTWLISAGVSRRSANYSTCRFSFCLTSLPALKMRQSLCLAVVTAIDHCHGSNDG